MLLRRGWNAAKPRNASAEREQLAYRMTIVEVPVMVPLAFLLTPWLMPSAADVRRIRH